MIKINTTNVTIMVKSMDDTIRFYENIGLTLKNRWGDHYAMMETAGLTIGIHPSDGSKINSGNVSIGFMIDKVEEGKTLLEKNNIPYKFFDDEKSGLYLNFSDPNGTFLYFVQPKW